MITINFDFKKQKTYSKQQALDNHEYKVHAYVLAFEMIEAKNNNGDENNSLDETFQAFKKYLNSYPYGHFIPTSQPSDHSNKFDVTVLMLYHSEIKTFVESLELFIATHHINDASNSINLGVCQRILLYYNLKFSNNKRIEYDERELIKDIVKKNDLFAFQNFLLTTKKSINAVDDEGSSLLHIVLKTQSPYSKNAFIEFLCDNEISFNLKNNLGQTVLDYGVSVNNAYYIDVIIKDTIESLFVPNKQLSKLSDIIKIRLNNFKNDGNTHSKKRIASADLVLQKLNSPEIIENDATYSLIALYNVIKIQKQEQEQNHKAYNLKALIFKNKSKLVKTYESILTYFPEAIIKMAEISPEIGNHSYMDRVISANSGNR